MVDPSDLFFRPWTHLAPRDQHVRAVHVWTERDKNDRTMGLRGHVDRERCL